MPSVMTVENRLKIYCDDSSVAETLLSNVPHTTQVFIPELADITVTSTPLELDYNTVSLKDFWNDGHIFWALPNKCGRFDQETVLTFLKGLVTRLEGIAVSPCHEFINDEYFNAFKNTHPDRIFDLLELDGPNETLMSTGTLEQLVSSHENIFISKVPNIIYSRDKKYFVRLANVTQFEAYDKVYGFFCIDERSVLEIAANRSPLDQRLKNLIYNVFTRFNGAFTFEYYKHMNKIYIYSFRTGVAKHHVREDILNIDVVQNTFKKMSVRYNFERTSDE